MKTIIGLWGQLGSGKSTVAAMLRDRHGFQEKMFAGPLKELCSELFGLTPAQVYGPSANRNAVDPRGEDPAYWQGVVYRAHTALRERIVGLFAERPTRLRSWEVMGCLTEVLVGLEALGPAFTPRAALQQMGAEFGRELWPSVWVNALVRDIAASAGDRVVVSDTRFANEAELIAGLGGVVAWVDVADRVPRGAHSAHQSEATFEQAAPFCQHILPNNGTLEDLESAVDALVAMYPVLRSLPANDVAALVA